MTEQDAKTRWCPFARTVERNGQESSQPRNRAADTVEDEVAEVPNLVATLCLGSACMAWRWLASETSRPRPGFCGLAGKP